MRYRLAIQKGWAIILTDHEPLPHDAEVVSEHDDGRQLVEAYDRLKVALAQARGTEKGVRPTH